MAQRMKPWPKDWVQKIEITTVPYASMRYKTPGDWLRTKDGVLHIAVPEEMGEESCIAVAIHELLETLLCEKHGVSEKVVGDFDLAVPDDSPYSDDPGWDPKAPYHVEHMMAELLERAFCSIMRLDWGEHEKNVEDLKHIDKGGGC